MKKKICMALALAMTVSSVLAGCGVGAKNEGVTETKAVSAETNTDTNKNTDTSTDANKDTSTNADTSVIYGTPTAPVGTFNPMISYMGSDNLINDLVYSALLEMKPDGSLTESLAESYAISEDQKTIEFTLRDGVKWQDGEDLTVDDVVFTIETVALTSDDYSKVARIEGAADVRDGKAEHMSGITTDGNKITIQLTEVDATFLNKIGGRSIIPKHIWGEIPFAEWEKKTELLNNPVGSGPYMLTKYNSGESVELKAFEDYFEGAPKIETFVLKVVNGDAIAAELSSGNIDIVDVKELKNAEVEDLKAEGFVKHSIADDMYQYISFNMRMPIFQDKNLRQAITYAIDRQSILDNIVEGRGSLINAPFIPGSWAEPAEGELNDYAYNPDKAIELLEASGWKDEDGDGIRENKDGEKLQFTLRCSNDSKTRENAVLYVKECLKKVGIDINVSIEEDSLIADDCIFNHNYEMYALNCYFGSDPDPYFWWHSSSAYDEPGVGSFNFGSYKNDYVDENIVAAQQTMDQDERAAYYLKVAKQINEDAPMIFLYVQNREIMTNPNLKGFDPGTFNVYYNVANWEMTE